jgi:hypothetical protein
MSAMFNTPAQARTLATLLEDAATDPTSTTHAEVGKAALVRCALALRFMAAQVESMAALLNNQPQAAKQPEGYLQ